MNKTPIRLPDAISRGCHERPEDGLCVMETVAFIAGERHSDHPGCASRVITEFAIRTNDAMPDDQTRTRLLGPLVWRIAGTRKGPDLERRLAYECADWAVRTVAPIALRAAGCEEDARQLENLAPVRDKQSARSAAYTTANAADTTANAASAAAKAAGTWPTRWDDQVAFLARLCDIAHAWEGE